MGAATEPSEAVPADPSITFSLVMMTYARDQMARQAIEQALVVVDGRPDVEFILVDNNPDEIDRSSWLTGFARSQCLKLGYNKGVTARNDGAQLAIGKYILFLDDDALLNPVGALERYEQNFAEIADLAIVTTRSIDHQTGQTIPRWFPHTNKSLPKDKPFLTFRFQGSGYVIRRDVMHKIGPLSETFFYGMEELDYAYRVVIAGYKIFYEPRCWCVEFNHPGGRQPNHLANEMRLTNKLIVSFRYLPIQYLALNVIAFTGFAWYTGRGHINPARAWINFARWVRRNWAERRPMPPAAIAYIRSCGGSVWR